MQRFLAVVLLVAGLSLVGWVLADRTGDDVGTVTVGSEDVAPITGTDAPPTPKPTPTPTTSFPSPDRSTPAAEIADATATPSPSPAPQIRRSSARIGDVDLSPPPAPTAISLPSIAVDAAIVAVGVDPDGLMTVPEDVDTVGWYRFGGAPASTTGTTVLAGHIDDRVQGRGAFFDLRAIAVGDEMTVTDEEGTTTTWRVTGRRTFDKASLPVDDLYRRSGARRLVLITCGGQFDRAARSYESNVVVEAEPLP